MVAVIADPPPDPKRAVDLVAAILAAGVALAAWISVVGGAVVWARFASAHISPGRSVSLQSRNYLIGEGFRALLFPLLLAAAAAGVAYIAYGMTVWVLRRRVRIVTVMASALGGAAVVAALLELRLHVHWKPVVELLFISVAAALVLFVGVRRAPSAGWVAGIIFAIVALWSGAFQYLTTEGQSHPKLDLAQVTLTAPRGKRVVGYFVARTGSDIYLAEPITAIERGRPRPGFAINVFPSADVLAFSFGPTRRANDNESEAKLLRVVQATP